MLSLTAKCHPLPHFKMKTLQKVGHFNLKMTCDFQCLHSLLVGLGWITQQAKGLSSPKVMGRGKAQTLIWEIFLTVIAYLEKVDHSNLLNYKLCDERKSSFPALDILEIYYTASRRSNKRSRGPWDPQTKINNANSTRHQGTKKCNLLYTRMLGKLEKNPFSHTKERATIDLMLKV